MEEEEEAKDVGVVGICIGGLYSLSVGDSIISCCFVWCKAGADRQFCGLGYFCYQ